MLLAALASLVIANTDAYEPFHAFWATPVLFGFAGEGSAFSPGEMVNKLLMTVFFFMMGLRIRNELRASTLSGVRTMAIPLFAAVGGLVLPIAFYLLACTGNPEASAGWAIPTATGIAFAIGVMALLGERVTEDTHAFLNSTALAGDIATVFIIAFFYTKNLSVLWIALTLAIIGVLLFLNKARVTSFVPYAVLGLGLWYCVLRSGFHPTMAGVVLAFTLPGNVPGGQEGQTMLQELQRRLFPLVFYVIVPLFAFSNGDVRLAGSGVAVMISSPVFLGTLLGLLLGKPLGIALFAALPVQLGVAPSARRLKPLQAIGAGCLCGIGFPMAIFVASLAFADPVLLDEAKAGILVASLLSGIAGCIVLRLIAGKTADAD